MDALPNDDCQPFLKMEEFPGIPPYAMPQPMAPVTPMPWENYGILMDPFQDPMQMMRQVYQQQQQPSPLPMVPPMVQPLVQPQVLPEKKPADSPKAPPAAPPGPDAIRSKMRDLLTDALKMVVDEQAKDELLSFLDSVKAPEVEPIPHTPLPPIQALAEVSSPVVRKPRSKKRMKVESNSEVRFEDRVAEHAKLVSKNIELELLRSFQAVNKKYREKARSLVFNLKDKSNPELRFRVFVGEITPQGLCSMKIDQLANRELSQWRMAKAEERAQMVVITDEDVNPSKLVKKTHKGEIIMEVENDAPDVPSLKANEDEDEAAMKTENETENENENEAEEKDGEAEQEPERRTGDENEDKNEETSEKTSAEVDDPGAGDGAGAGVNEESSDALLYVSDFKGLPEIMSMDGFLKSIGCTQREDGSEMNDEEMKDAENIQLDESSRSGSGDLQQVNPLKRKLSVEEDEEQQQQQQAAGEKQKSPSPASAASPKAESPEAEEKSRSLHLWDGSLQLTGTRSTGVRAVFRSGQDVSLESWPKQLEVKGRVKLGPLAKFLKDLNSSKSRVVTAVSFYSSDMATSSLSLLKEVVDQYEKGERVGYVEPGVGFELYLFPPGKTTWRFLTENGRLKPSEESNIPEDRGEVLVGCIVWRKKSSSSSATSQDEKKRSSSTTSSSKKNNRSSSSSRSKHSSSSVSVSLSPPAATKTPSSSHHHHHHHHKSSSTPVSLQQSSSSSSLSVVQKDSVNEWQQSSLASPNPPPDSVPVPVPGPVAPPLSDRHQLQLPPGFSVQQISSLLSSLAPGARLPGYDAPPPGFLQSSSLHDLDDLPEYEYEGLMPVFSAGMMGAGGGFQGVVSQGFPASSEGIQGAHHHQLQQEWQQHQHHHQHQQQQQQMRSGGFQQGKQQVQQQQQQMPPGPPQQMPPAGVASSSFGQHWVHPNQAAQQKSLHYNKSSSARPSGSSSGSSQQQRRYRS